MKLLILSMHRRLPILLFIATLISCSTMVQAQDLTLTTTPSMKLLTFDDSSLRGVIGKSSQFPGISAGSYMSLPLSSGFVLSTQHCTLSLSARPQFRVNAFQKRWEANGRALYHVQGSSSTPTEKRTVFKVFKWVGLGLMGVGGAGLVYGFMEKNECYGSYCYSEDRSMWKAAGAIDLATGATLFIIGMVKN